MFLLGGFAGANAATISARTGSIPDVTKAIDLAAEGDTVTIPAGTYSWQSQLTISKNITLKGASVFPFSSAGTVILDDMTGTARSANGACLIKVVLSKDKPVFRLSGLRLANGSTAKNTRLVSEVGFTGGSSPEQSPAPKVVGESQIRMDNCEFQNTLHDLPVVFRDVIGVVDHVVRNGKNEFAQVYMKHWNGKDNGHGSWADNPYWGSDKFLFFEDCRFSAPGGGNVLYGIDVYGGGRVVSRHNTWHNTGPTAHGTEAGIFRGGKQWEIYKDAYTSDAPMSFPQLRSGTVIMHDNTFSNIMSGMSFQLYALSNYPINWGKSDGTRPWDRNAPNATTGYYVTGTHTGANGSTLVDSTKKWGTNQWVAPAASYVVINTSAPVDQNGDRKLAPITGNGATYLVHNNSRVTFNTGEHYQIWKVITSLDQPGQGKGALLTYANGITRVSSGARNTDGSLRTQSYPANFEDWPQRGYPLEPCYAWNNVSLGGSAGAVPDAGQQIPFNNAQPTFLKEGRDYFDKGNVGSTAQRVGPPPNTYLYVPFTYPHPLTK